MKFGLYHGTIPAFRLSKHNMNDYKHGNEQYRNSLRKAPLTIRNKSFCASQALKDFNYRRVTITRIWLIFVHDTRNKILILLHSSWQSCWHTKLMNNSTIITSLRNSFLVKIIRILSWSSCLDMHDQYKCTPTILVVKQYFLLYWTCQRIWLCIKQLCTLTKDSTSQ